MIKLINQQTDVSQAGAYIENGMITAFKTVDLDPFLEDVKRFREEYNAGDKPKDMHHVARLEADVIENIRIHNKWPPNQEGFKMAVKEAVRMVRSGELEAFRIHEY